MSKDSRKKYFCKCPICGHEFYACKSIFQEDFEIAKGGRAEMRLIAGYIGQVKNFKPIDLTKKEDPRTAILKGQQQKSITHILPHGGGKSNYSVVCRRCNRKLTSEVSRNRGYGSYCYRKTREEKAREKVRKEIEGQMNIDDILKEGQGNEN